MGQSFKCRCNKCGYGFYANLGIGFSFFSHMAETKEAMKKGEYGSHFIS